MPDHLPARVAPGPVCPGSASADLELAPVHADNGRMARARCLLAILATALTDKERGGRAVRSAPRRTGSRPRVLPQCSASGGHPDTRPGPRNPEQADLDLA